MNASIACVTRQGAIRRTTIRALLAPALRERARDETYRWIKQLRHARFDGVPMRERFTYNGDSLWWFTELYLHKMRRLETAIGTVLALDQAHATLEPARIAVDSPDAAVREAASAFGLSRRLAIDVTGSDLRTRRDASTYWTEVVARLSRFHRTRRPRQRARVAAFVHTAFWKAGGETEGLGRETYIGPVLDAVAARIGADDLVCVGVGPRRNFRARRWWDPIAATGAPGQVIPVEDLAPSRALSGSVQVLRRRRMLAAALTEGADIRAAGTVLGCDLWPLLARELTQAALVQWPWSARVLDEAGAAIDALAARVVVTYAEAGGWGRAIVLAARRRGVPSVGIQHGFIYRHWLNYLHESDEFAPAGADEGFPAPDRTLLFDGYARAHLERLGHFPPARLAVTGSARLDDLARRVEALQPARPAIREELGARPEGRLVVLVAKFSEIRDELPALAAALAARPEARLVVKPHPAETATLYQPFVATVPNAAILPASADLARLLAAADGLVTMNSTVAIDGLVLGVPSLVIGWPTNLSPFVEAGVMLGGATLPLAESLGRLLYHQPTRDALRSRAREFAGTHAMRADGLAAARAADEILAAGERTDRIVG
jgi:hypothetical protein